MLTYEYHDYGQRPTLQCTVQAKDIDDANEQVRAKGLPLHRFSAVLQLPAAIPLATVPLPE